MRILLDTNIIIHREASTVVNPDIGILFRWIDKLHHTKCIHPITIMEIHSYKNTSTVKSFDIKLESYAQLQTVAPLHNDIVANISPLDASQNDKNDTQLLNEVYSNRVDAFITEDRKVHQKAALLGISDRIYTIDSFLEKVTSENPQLIEYKIPTIKRDLFGKINLSDPFFNSFRNEYIEFDKWFNSKAEEVAYTCSTDGQLVAFLYIKLEDQNEDYSDIVPTFNRKRRLKIGTFKVSLNGYKLGERFIKIIYDNALRLKVEEIYVTIFNSDQDRSRLILLLKDWGFVEYGIKKSASGDELVLVRDLKPSINKDKPRITFPYISRNANIFIVPIYPAYHTSLFPDSILNNESPLNFVENEPHRNAISKVYICRSIERNLHSGDIIVFYRTGGYYEGVVTTIGLVESVVSNIKDENHFISLCRKRSVFTDKELSEHWNYRPLNRPFIVNFLYVYSLPKRPNLKRLIELGVIKSVNDVPRGFEKITQDQFDIIIKEAQVDESIIVH